MILGKFFQKNTEKIYKETNKKKEELRILELGTGTGILGIFLGCLGWNVVSTDLGSVIKGATEENIKQNLETLKVYNGSVEALRLDW